MLEPKLAQFATLPELEVQKLRLQKGILTFYCLKKRNTCEICPKCATPSTAYYDKREVLIKDEPLRKQSCALVITKHRYYCGFCHKPFTESVAGILPRQRTTQRFRRALLWACQHFSSLKAVRKEYRCSNDLLYRAVYEMLERKLREYQTPWPEVVGIDEHFFTRRKGYSEFFTVFVDIKNHRVRDAVLGRSKNEVLSKVDHIKGREKVKWCITDLSETYRSLVKTQFVNANLVADKFHVLRLLSPALRRRRIEITGDKRTLRIKRLLQKNRHRLNYFERQDVDRFINKYPELAEVYRTKERLHEVYRCKGIARAKASLERLIEQAQKSTVTELNQLAKTLSKWKEEILNYFITGYTNAMTEGFNRVASLVKNRGFGYTNPNNYRLKYLSACAN